MKRFLLCLVIAATCSTASLGQAPVAVPEAAISVYFSPNGGCTETVVKEIPYWETGQGSAVANDGAELIRSSGGTTTWTH